MVLLLAAVFVFFESAICNAQTVSVPVLRGTPPPTVEELASPSPSPSALPTSRPRKRRRISPTPLPTATPADDLSDIQMLERVREDAKEKIADLNRLNPLGPSTAPGEVAGPTLELKNGLHEQTSSAQQRLLNLVRERTLQIVHTARSDAFVEASRKIVNSPNLRWFYGLVIGSFFSFIWVRRRVLAGTDRFFSRFFLKTGIGLLFLVTLAAISFACFGQAATDVLVLLLTASR